MTRATRAFAPATSRVASRVASLVSSLALALATASMGIPATAAGAPAPVHRETAPGPARVLIVGDSVTQGKVGDHTWRYRLWRRLAAAGRWVDFVGPHTGLYDPASATFDNPGYADPDFDQDHAAWWGLSLTHLDTRFDLHDLLVAEQPDIVINDLGFNDLVYVARPDQLIDLMSQFVAEVRDVTPSATVILGELTQTWYVNNAGEPVITEYNALLDDLATQLDRPDARVLAAPRPTDYVENVDTYDPAHPSRTGEIKIAAQFAGVLSSLGLPAAPPAAYAGAATLTGVARNRAAVLHFTTPAGATRQVIAQRDLTADGDWRRIAEVGAKAHRYRVTALRHGHTYAFRLRAYRGAERSTTTSDRLRVRIR